MKRLFARAGLSALAVMWVVAISAAPTHADEGWVITAFSSVIQIRPDSALDITEDIRVDFGGLAKHGIFRTIPLRYRYSDKQDRYYALAVNSVTDGTRPVQYTKTIEVAEAVAAEAGSKLGPRSGPSVHEWPCARPAKRSSVHTWSRA